MKKFKIKKGDKVEVVAGNDKGKKGDILVVFPKIDKVLVEGCNIIKKSIKPTEKNNKKIGFESKESPIHISNIKKVEG